MGSPKTVRHGDRYGYLTIVSEQPRYLDYNNKPRRQFLCQCDCGKLKTIHFDRLLKKQVVSCGCKSLEGRPEGNPTHGLGRHPLYSVWTNMKNRCLNPEYKKFHRYGGRGIKVCNEWLHDFQQFYDDMIDGYKSGLTIDRINNDGNYEPSNCRWATNQEQADNRPYDNYVKKVIDVSIKITIVR